MATPQTNQWEVANETPTASAAPSAPISLNTALRGPTPAPAAPTNLSDTLHGTPGGAPQTAAPVWEVAGEQPAPATDPNDDSQGHGPLQNFATGFGKGVLQTTTGIGELIHKIPVVGPALIPEEGLQREGELSQTHGIAQGLGAGAEMAAEWAAGDEALSGIAKLAKVPSRILALAEKYPKTAALIHGATIGTAQGTVKGAAEGDAIGGAEGGAVGGAIGGWTGEALSGAVRAGLEKLGMKTPAIMDAMRAAKPEKWNKNFVGDWEVAAPRIVKTLNGDVKFNNLWDAANSIRWAANEQWENEVKPLLRQYGTRRVDLTDVAQHLDGIRATIDPQIFPADYTYFQTLADAYRGKQVPISDVENILERLNGKLRNTGFYSKSPNAQAAAMSAHEIEGLRESADAIRDILGNSIPGFNKERQVYGAMSNVANTVAGQANVYGRQNPLSLKQIIGAASGMASGNPTAIGSGILLPLLDKWYNDPAALLARGLTKQAGTSLKQKAVDVASEGAIQATKQAIGATGRAVGSEHRISVRSSNGITYSVPSDQLERIQQLDPQATVLGSQ